MAYGKIDWVNATFLIGYQLAFLVALPLYVVFVDQRLALWMTMAALVFACGIGVTSLYHRHYSHRTYKMSEAAQGVTLLFGTLAVQGSALQWAHDHRLHHRFVDTQNDPYAITKGFWHAHFLWMLYRRPAVDPAVVDDLMRNRLVRFQHRYYGWLVLAANLGVVALFGWIFNDYLGAFVVLFLTRLFINHHTTWFINSLAHTWGVKPYSREHSAVNNWVISLLTYGEGYHNYHHTFAGDYRNGTRWYHFDPTKALIWGMAKIGIAKDLRQVDKTLIARRLVDEDRKLVLEKAKAVRYIDWSGVEKEITARASALSARLVELGDTLREYRRLKSARANAEAKRLRARLKALKRGLRLELRSWSRYCDSVLRLKTTLA